jgi:hypothetical protein
MPGLPPQGICAATGTAQADSTVAATISNTNKSIRLLCIQLSFCTFLSSRTDQTLRHLRTPGFAEVCIRLQDTRVSSPPRGSSPKEGGFAHYGTAWRKEF